MAVLTKGTVLENTYEILEEIGSGGGGVVFKARHLRLQTDIVVKKIKDDVREKIRSRQEADILKKLKHSYLPRVYDFIETDEGVYTVMDFIHGKNLDEAVKEHGRYPQKQVRKWADQLGQALAYLHDQNPPIIHSDIKPANIMLTEDGDVCLIDFNISLAMGGTMESAVGISLGYSPPEQYRDPVLYAKYTHNYTVQKVTGAVSETAVLQQEEDRTEILGSLQEEDRTEVLVPKQDQTELLPKQETQKSTGGTGKKSVIQKDSKVISYIGKGIDARSDIYSLGITLYYLLTGIEPPVDFDHRIPLAEINIPISEGFSIILEKMMQTSPDERYQNGTDFLKAIQNCHKLDRRYVVMHRKQTGMQIAALACMVAGILTVFGGMRLLRMGQNSDYYELVHQAKTMAETGDYKQADLLLSEAKEMLETRIEAYEEEIYLLYLCGNYEECIELGEAYINTTPFVINTKEEKELFGNIYYIVGNSYFETGAYPDAKRLFEYALEYNVGNGLYYRDYAITLAKLGQLEEAERQLENGIGLGIAEDSVYMAQGEIAHVRGQYEDAWNYLNKTITETDDMQIKKRAIMLSVDVCRSKPDAVDQEIALLEQYKDQFIGNGNLVMTEYLAEAYTRKAQSDEAQAELYYEKALTLFQQLSDSGYSTYQLKQNIAILHEYMEQFDEAEAIFKQLTEEYPERYETYKRLAFLEADRQQTKDIVERDYAQMKLYYEQANERYTDKEFDEEMEMLELMILELTDGGWL